jgi:pantetheine-phosphate adenylyltransferase/dephospho-CoA kinase
MKKQITVLFTGGIGSGKTTILGYLQEHYGIPVFYSDYEAKALYTDPKILAHVNKIVGGGIITEYGSLDKAALAKIIFSDADKKKKLEAYIHPKVRERFNVWKKTKISPIVIMESAIALQNNGRKNFDYVVFVDAPESVRLERTMKRDNSSSEKILARMKSQCLDSSLADFIINNEFDFHESADKCIMDLLNKIANKAVFAGSFDPFTNGHLAILKKACAIFDTVYLGIAPNPNKNRNYPIEEMKAAIQKTLEIEKITNCEVSIYSCLTVRFCRKVGAMFLVRGLRNENDFTYEEDLAKKNRWFDREIETIYLRADDEIISSSFVRDVYKSGEDITSLVPQPIKKLMLSYNI